MLEKDVQKQINRLTGALDILALLRERIELQLGEVADQSGREALDETLSYVVAAQAEYQHRQRELHPHHKTFLFYLTDEGVLPLSHDGYIPLIEGKPGACGFFNRRLRLADWYVRMDKDKPVQVVNETYSWLVFDQHGRLNLHAAHAITESPLPGEAERKEIEQQLFAAA